MTITLDEELERLILNRLEAGEYSSASEVVSAALKSLERSNPRNGQPTSLWTKIDQIVDEIPQEERNNFPEDFALEHDHYAHGTPKKYT